MSDMHSGAGAEGDRPAVVVFGRDHRGKPHASRFEAADAELAEKAAGLMGMRVLRIASDQHEALAVRLPPGRVFASGRGFMPFVKAELFAQLDAEPGAFAPERPAGAVASAPHSPKGGRSAGQVSKADWPGIKTGSLVLAAEEGYPTYWYVATVIAERGHDLFELRWWEDDGTTVVRRREHLGLFPAAAVEALAGAP